MFIKNLISRHNRVVNERNTECDNLICQINDAILSIKSLFSCSVFIDQGAETAWTNQHVDVLTASELCKIQKLKKAKNYKTLYSKQQELFDAVNTLTLQIKKHNKNVLDSKVKLAYSLIDNVEGHKLDIQQMQCIVKEAHNHLVIAGAGTGKTTTVIGKIKYLLKAVQCLPQDILVLSFTNASASEMSERISFETGHNITTSTFHKLGLNIISQVNGVMPQITQINLRKFIKEQLTLNMQYMHI